MLKESIYINALLGLGSKQEGPETFESKSIHVPFVAKKIKLPCPNQSVVEFTRDLVEKYIPKEWLLQICLFLNNRNKVVNLSYGCGYDTRVQLKYKAANTSINKEAYDDSMCNLAITLAVGESVTDAVTLSADDNICDYVCNWKSMPSSNDKISGRLHLWLDVNVASHYSHYVLKEDNDNRKSRNITLWAPVQLTNITNDKGEKDKPASRKRRVPKTQEHGKIDIEKTKKKMKALNGPVVVKNTEASQDRSHCKFLDNEQDVSQHVPALGKIEVNKPVKKFIRRKRSNPPKLVN
jgi:hypothetical protein